MGFYLLVPFLLVRLGDFIKQSQIGYLRLIVWFNRFGQYALILEIISGIYLFTHLRLSTLWIVLMIVFVLGIGAFAGILGVKLKKLVTSMQTQAAPLPKVQSIQSLGWLSAISFFLVIIVMCFRNYI